MNLRWPWTSRIDFYVHNHEGHSEIKREHKEDNYEGNKFSQGDTDHLNKKAKLIENSDKKQTLAEGL